MRLSIVICTYRRANDAVRLLQCLAVQSFRNFEVLIVDGSGEDPAVREQVKSFVDQARVQLDLRLIQVPKGLTRQRNAALRAFEGDAICFLDDDVVIDEHFLQTVDSLLSRPDMQDVGGLGGYDMLIANQSLPIEWRIRRWLGLVRCLEPGDVAPLGRAVPNSLRAPFHGISTTGWLPGYCMIYRRVAVADVWFDECLPTYAGEDIDFSRRIGKQWRLVIGGDLRLDHWQSPCSRVSNLQRAYQCGFGVGRGFAKSVEGFLDYCLFPRNLLGEFVIGVGTFVRHPSQRGLFNPFAMVMGMIAGLWSPRQQSNS